MPTIATNNAANSAIVFLNRNSQDQESSLGKLSSGSRIVRASDDAAGLGVSEELRADISTFEAAGRNATQGIAVLGTADGALAQIGEILQRAKALSAQAQSGSVDATSRGFIDDEYQELVAEVDAIETSTRFNGVQLIDATFQEDFLVGTDGATDVIDVDLTGVNADFASLGGAAAGDLTSQANAATASGVIDTAITAVSTARSTIGSFISRFEFRGEYISDALNNLQAANASIRDTDIAVEQTNFTNFQVLTETAIASLAQANQLKQSLLALVR